MLSGILLVDKPKGLTSMEVVESIKKRFGLKAGHAGTLDPIATGLLIVLLEEATKFSQFFIGLDKTYITTLKLGEIRDTYDEEGKVIETRPVKVSCHEVSLALEKFKGELLQKPPPFSAKRIGGKRAYELARKGIEVDVKPVKVTVHKAEILSCNIPYAELLFEVSSGTYIRSLAHDLGLYLSCGAYVVQLRRIKIGEFSVEKAVNYERLMSLMDISGLIIPIDEALYFLPKVNLRKDLSRKIKYGMPIKLEAPYERIFLRLYEGDKFLGVGLIEGDTLKPYRLMRGL